MLPNLNFGTPALGSISSYGLPPAGGQFNMGMPTVAPAPVPAPMPVAMPSISGSGPGAAAADVPAATAAASPEFSLGGAMKGLVFQDGKLNLDGLSDLAGIASSLGSLWGSFQANSLAKDALKFQKDSYNTNLSNQLSSYNLALEDRIRSRYAQEGRSSADADQYIDRNRLKA